jgi:hypothetical protein
MACFTWKQLGLGFSSFATKLVEERRQVVHVASSQRSRESEAGDDRFDSVECDAVEVEPKYPSLTVILFLIHRNILAF